MTTIQHARPWYCSNTLCDAYKQIEKTRGNLRMLQSLKIIRAIVLNLLLAGFGAFAILQEADPTITAVLTITALGLVNGIEVSEWVAAKQALQELEVEEQDGDGPE